VKFLKQNSSSASIVVDGGEGGQEAPEVCHLKHMLLCQGRRGRLLINIHQPAAHPKQLGAANLKSCDLCPPIISHLRSLCSRSLKKKTYASNKRLWKTFNVVCLLHFVLILSEIQRPLSYTRDHKTAKSTNAVMYTTIKIFRRVATPKQCNAWP
jgi:hypothetical protein